MSTLSETLRAAIQNSGKSYYKLSLETGLNRQVLARFAQEQTTLHLGAADVLAEHFGLELRPARRPRARKEG